MFGDTFAKVTIFGPNSRNNQAVASASLFTGDGPGSFASPRDGGRLMEDSCALSGPCLKPSQARRLPSSLRVASFGPNGERQVRILPEKPLP